MGGYQRRVTRGQVMIRGERLWLSNLGIIRDYRRLRLCFNHDISASIYLLGDDSRLVFKLHLKQSDATTVAIKLAAVGQNRLLLVATKSLSGYVSSFRQDIGDSSSLSPLY